MKPVFGILIFVTGTLLFPGTSHAETPLAEPLPAIWGSAADLNVRELSLERDATRLIPSLGGPSLAEPFGYDPSYLEEVYPQLSPDSESLPSASNSYVSPLIWVNPDGSFTGNQRGLSLGR